MPYPGIFGFLEGLAIDMGGSSGSLGSQDEPSVFRINDSLTVAPVICYESIFGEYVSRYVRKNANLITIITNDGWWQDSPGYRQHMMYAVLRAIETRRFIARAANTGISCFILPNGSVLSPTPYWKSAAIKSAFNSEKELTFYTRYGDYLGRAAVFAGLLLLVLSIIGKPNQIFFYWISPKS
jgi:apolipoprotein N-acyltransferase